jgi:hypothetical protein
MGDNPFGRRPYLDRGIDLWKVLFVAALFLIFLGWYVYTW